MAQTSLCRVMRCERPSGGPLICQLAFLLVCGLTSLLSAADHVEFELVTESGFPIHGTRDWVTVFQGIPNTSFRIRSAGAGDQERVTNRGSEDRPRFHVVGILSAKNRLFLPGSKSFSVRDRAGIQAWINQLREDGISGLTNERVAFGMLAADLVSLHERLAVPITFSTKDTRAGDAARKIVNSLAIDFVVTDAGRAEFRRAGLVEDELNGLAHGTALAVILRPLGLVFAPRKRQGVVELHIATPSEQKEHWPIGWPLQNSPYKTSPSLFEYRNVKIENATLESAVQAIRPLIDEPMIFDRNALARHRIDLSEARASFPEKRTFTRKILDNLLFQAGMSSKLLLDDGDRPFLWITSNRSPR